MRKYLLLHAASCMLVLNACQQTAKKPESSSKVQYKILPLQKKDTVIQIHYVAHITARRNVELRSRIPGILEKVYVEEGQVVRNGQLLFRVNNQEAGINLSQADAALKKAIAECKVIEVQRLRTKALVDKKIISTSELDLLDAKLEAQRAKVEEARSSKSVASSKLSYTSIYAPFDGLIDRIPFREGSLVAGSSLLTTVSDIESIYAYFDVPESEYFQFIKKAKTSNGLGEISLILADGSTYPIKGKVMPAESEIDNNTGSIAFRAVFANPDKMLLHGASATLSIKRKLAEAMLIPQKSVVEIQDRTYVYTVDNKNLVHMKNFVPKQRIGNYYLVASGIEVKDRIVAEGVQRLKDGMKINIQ